MANFRPNNQRRRGSLLPNSAASSWTSYLPPPTEYDDNGGFQLNRVQMMQKETEILKNENAAIKTYLNELQNDRNKLRNAMCKLKVENGRLKAKLKRVDDALKGEATVGSVDEIIGEIDYETVKQFLLIGGPKDPLDFQYPVTVHDKSNCPHKSGERYMWYKMAELFDDTIAMQSILTAEDSKVDEILGKIKKYDKPTWDAAKMKLFEEYQRWKFAQHRQLKCLLILSGSIYLAMSIQDKVYGTGWRKQRSEADRPQMWDGLNLGGKILMKLRSEFVAEHVWNSANEEEESRKLYNDHALKNTWKRIQMKRRAPSATPRIPIEDGTSQFHGEGYTNFVDQPYSSRSQIAGSGRGRYNGNNGSFFDRN